ncbi:MAG: hypothetical protein K2X37_12050 [Chitinophagaceae bacterium]|nr:hypothetical protein [Chitinophagaceae bacterium]
MKTYDYIVQLKTSNKSGIDWISKLMLFITVAIFIANTFLEPGRRNVIPMIICLLIMGWMIFCYTQQRRGVQPFYRLALLFAAIGWFIHPPYGIWISLIYLIAAVLERFVKFPEEIAFDKDEVVINSFPKKRYTWNELNNVVLKDGLLTIDFKKNKILQKLVDSEVDVQVEEEFTAYARGLIKGE